MLETDEVDDDYFTPVASTSLASIFGNSSRPEAGTENETLKYTPPKSQNESKASAKSAECIFACAFFAYEWFGNAYSPKGKVGFAIIHKSKITSHDIVLYDSNKVMLSSTTVTPSLEVTVKGNLYFSYYDNLNKYWSIYATEEEIKKVIEILRSLNVSITHSQYTDKGPPEPNEVENEKHEPENVNIGSNTDSSLNKNTKESILNRMANMGQSVLPRRALSTERTSDSSDTNENTRDHKTLRHKPIRNIVKRVNTDNAQEMHNSIEVNTLTPATRNSVNTIPLYAYNTGQLMPLENNRVVSQENKHELHLFMTEQRICNSELRINIGRMTDKVDQVLHKIRDMGDTDKSDITTTNFQVAIMQKLLTEYENKIKAYEQIITTNDYKKDIDKVIPIVSNFDISNSEIELFKCRISSLEDIVTEKNREITKLNEHIKYITDKSIKENEHEAELQKEITDLKYSLSLQQEEIANMTTKLNDITSLNNPVSHDKASKLKSVMNDVFRNIAVNFKTDDNYSGDTIKSIVATAIKQVTIDTLSDK